MSAKRFAMLVVDLLYSRKVDALPLDAEAAYVRLHLATDKYGTMPGSTRDIVSRAFPSRGVTADRVAELIDQLDDAGLIERWTEPEGRHAGEWLHITRFDECQDANFLRKRGKRHTPIPPSAAPTTPDSATHGRTDSYAGILPQVRPATPASEVRGTRYLPPTSRVVTDTTDDEAAQLRQLVNAYRAKGESLLDRLHSLEATDAARTESSGPESGGGEPLHIDGRGAADDRAIATEPSGSTPAEAPAAELDRSRLPGAPQSASHRDAVGSSSPREAVAS